MADLCADEILREVRRLWARVAVPVTAAKVAERIGAEPCGVGRRMAELARQGHLTATGNAYSPVQP